MKHKVHFTVFEHDTLKVGQAGFTEPQRRILEDYHGNGSPFFSLVHNGVKFNEHVGVLQAGELTIEVLPKADRDSAGGETVWRDFLITMLQAAGLLPEDTGYAALRLRSHSILDLYLLLFLHEVRQLMQRGLTRQYRKEEGNVLALKGSLLFAQNIRHNVTHSERFYTRHTVYDRDHPHNAIIRQALVFISRITLSPFIKSDAEGLLLDFPECHEVKVSEALFQKLVYSRKTEGYRTAHGIARLLLLNYHPDVRRGTADVLALMFDMNALWEKYIARLLRRELQKIHSGKYILREQVRTNFWQPGGGYMRTVKPDIALFKTEEPDNAVLVLDTKWKRIPDSRPADEDLKQMLVYNLFRGCKYSALVYPASGQRGGVEGRYVENVGTYCALCFVPLFLIKGCMKPDLTGIMNLVEIAAGRQKS